MLQWLFCVSKKRSASISPETRDIPGVNKQKEKADNSQIHAVCTANSAQPTSNLVVISGQTLVANTGGFRFSQTANTSENGIVFIPQSKQPSSAAYTSHVQPVSKPTKNTPIIVSNKPDESHSHHQSEHDTTRDSQAHNVNLHLDTQVSVNSSTTKFVDPFANAINSGQHLLNAGAVQGMIEGDFHGPFASIGNNARSLFTHAVTVNQDEFIDPFEKAINSGQHFLNSEIVNNISEGNFQESLSSITDNAHSLFTQTIPAHQDAFIDPFANVINSGQDLLHSDVIQNISGEDFQGLLTSIADNAHSVFVNADDHLGNFSEIGNSALTDNAMGFFNHLDDNVNDAIATLGNFVEDVFSF